MTAGDVRDGQLPALTDVLGEAAAGFPAVPLGGGLTLVVVADPGRALGVGAHRRLYRALVPVTTRAFGADMTSYWELRSREGYLERLAEFALVTAGDGAIVGWTGYHLLHYDDYTSVYVDSTGIVPEWQSRGTMRRLLDDRITVSALARCAPGRPVYLTARTENPVFYRLVRGLLGEAPLYPDPCRPAPEEVVRCGVDLAEWLGQRELLHPPTLTLRGAYGVLDRVYGEPPNTDEPHLRWLFGGYLGPLDAVLLVARLR